MCTFFHSILYSFPDRFLVMSSILRIRIHNTYKGPAIYLSLPILYVAKVLNMNSVLRLYPCGRHDILAEMFKARKYPATKGSAGDEEGSA